MVTSEEKVEAGKDGYFGRIPQTLIEEELSAIISWSDTSCEIVSLSLTEFLYRRIPELTLVIYSFLLPGTNEKSL